MSIGCSSFGRNAAWYGSEPTTNRACYPGSVSTARRLHYAYEDYLRLLERSDFKLEYCDGIIYAMPGGTPTHAALAAAIIRVLGTSLLGSCNVFSSDLKVRIEASDLTTFPDVTVVCGAHTTSEIDPHAVTNPTVLVEVTSRSTEDYDRGDKLSHYKQLPSLRAVFFVSHRRAQITIVERSATGWDEREVRSGERVVLADPALDVGLDDIYAGIALDPA